MNLPLQNFWRDEVLPADMPIALLPLSQYYLVAAAAMVVVGAALGGLTARFAARRGRPLRAWLVAVGAVTVQCVALAQAIWVLDNGLQDSTRARWYVIAAFVGIAMAIIVGMAVAVIIAKGVAAAATIAITIAALALGEWLPTVLFPIGNPTLFNFPRLLSSGVLWLPVVAVGLAVGWCGFNSVRRAVASVLSLLTFWAGSAAVTGLALVIGSRALLQNPSDLLPAAVQTFRSTLWSFDLVQQMLLGVVIAIIVTATIQALRRIDLENEEAAAREPDPPA